MLPSGGQEENITSISDDFFQSSSREPDIYFDAFSSHRFQDDELFSSTTSLDPYPSPFELPSPELVSKPDDFLYCGPSCQLPKNVLQRDIQQLLFAFIQVRTSQFCRGIINW